MCVCAFELLSELFAFFSSSQGSGLYCSRRRWALGPVRRDRTEAKGTFPAGVCTRPWWVNTHTHTHMTWHYINTYACLHLVAVIVFLKHTAARLRLQSKNPPSSSRLIMVLVDCWVNKESRGRRGLIRPSGSLLGCSAAVTLHLQADVRDWSKIRLLQAVVLARQVMSSLLFTVNSTLLHLRWSLKAHVAESGSRQEHTHTQEYVKKCIKAEVNSQRCCGGLF